MIPRRNTTADIMGLEVTYFGLNGVKQHMFGNGSPLATDIFNTLEEAVERFGKRIKIDSRAYVQSINFKAGYADTSYAPRPNMDRVERIEYGMGYLKRLIERDEAAKTAAKPNPVDMRLPHEVMADRAKVAQAKPVPDEALRKRLEESRAALAAAPVEFEADALPEVAPDPVPKADIAASIGAIAKRGRGRPPKVT
jgi:hypothetical protein